MGDIVPSDKKTGAFMITIDAQEPGTTLLLTPFNGEMQHNMIVNGKVGDLVEVTLPNKPVSTNNGYLDPNDPSLNTPPSGNGAGATGSTNGTNAAQGGNAAQGKQPGNTNQANTSNNDVNSGKANDNAGGANGENADNSTLVAKNNAANHTNEAGTLANSDTQAPTTDATAQHAPRIHGKHAQASLAKTGDSSILAAIAGVVGIVSGGVLMRMRPRKKRGRHAQQ